MSQEKGSEQRAGALSDGFWPKFPIFQRVLTIFASHGGSETANLEEGGSARGGRGHLNVGTFVDMLIARANVASTC